MPPQELIALFLKAMLCCNFKGVYLHYEDRGVHKLSFLTFRILNTKKLSFFIYADDIENWSFLTFETLHLVPS